MENLVTISIRSTHYYLIDLGRGKFMVDAGWAGEMPALKSQLKRVGIDLAEIHYVLITHFHPDHAGLAQEIKQASQARLVFLENQIPLMKELDTFYAGKGSYVPIRVESSDLILPASNRADLLRIGLLGEVVETPGHSDDSVSLVLDSGLAFTGDLPRPDLAADEARPVTCQSWKKLLALNARTIYPAHGDPFPVSDIQRTLTGC